jgi:acyl-CoA thioesterase I
MRLSIRFFVLISSLFLAIASAGCAASRPSATQTNKPLAVPPATVSRPKIIAFGDSLTAGFGLTEKESYPYLLQERLRADGFDYEVVNAGLSGDTTLGGLERADWVLEQDRVELLILELGANDLLRGMPVAKIKTNLDTIIRKAKAKKIKVLLCGMLAPPTMGAEYSRDFTIMFPDLASEHKIEFLPFLLENVALKKELNQGDGIHPNPAGTRIMTDNIYKALKPML